jgi:hypothetical protein
MSTVHDLEKGTASHHTDALHSSSSANLDIEHSHAAARRQGHDADLEGGYKNGSSVQRHVTPGGHPVDDSQPAFPVYHRK